VFVVATVNAAIAIVFIAIIDPHDADRSERGHKRDGDVREEVGQASTDLLHLQIHLVVSSSWSSFVMFVVRYTRWFL
jgi:hypothetical protein